MAEYAVECADKVDGKSYVIRVEADTHQHAIEKASAQHEVRRAHRIDFTPAQPKPSIEEEMLALMREQANLLRRLENWSMLINVGQSKVSPMILSAVVHFIVFSIGALILGFVLRPFIWLSASQ